MFRLSVCLAMVVPTLGTVVYFVIMGQSRAAQLFYGATKLFTLVWPMLIVLGLEKKRLRFKGIDWARHFRAVPMGILLGAVIVALMVVLFRFTIIGDYVRGCSDVVRGKAVDLGFLGCYWTFAVFLSLGHSALEEYYWRWFVFGSLVRFTPVGWAYFLAGLSFAGHHYVVLGTFFPLWLAAVLGTLVGVGGVIWCWLFRKYGSLAGAWVSHLMVDAGIMWIGYELIF